MSHLCDTVHRLFKSLQLTGPIETTHCDYESIDDVNVELFGNLSELVHFPFFRYFQVRNSLMFSSYKISYVLAGRFVSRMSILDRQWFLQ